MHYPDNKQCCLITYVGMLELNAVLVTYVYTHSIPRYLVESTTSTVSRFPREWKLTRCDHAHYMQEQSHIFYCTIEIALPDIACPR